MYKRPRINRKFSQLFRSQLGEIKLMRTDPFSLSMIFSEFLIRIFPSFKNMKPPRRGQKRLQLTETSKGRSLSHSKVSAKPTTSAWKSDRVPDRGELFPRAPIHTLIVPVPVVSLFNNRHRNQSSPVHAIARGVFSYGLFFHLDLPETEI